MDYRIRKLAPIDLPAATALAWRVFSEFEAPDYSTEGIEEFKQFIQPSALASKVEEGTLVFWGAFVGENVVGVLAANPQGHIHLWFVDKAFHRQGIGKKLFENYTATLTPGSRLSVHSSPYALPIYQRLGYHATGPEQTVNGLRFIPMAQVLP